MSYLENALFQWEDGWHSLQALSDPAARRRAERFIGAVRDELRRRVGATFTTAELATEYRRGTDWCMSLAIEVAPTLGVAVQPYADAAFWLHMRGASDFAGGRPLAV